MGPDLAAVSVLAAVLSGGLLSIVIESLMQPRPPLRRPWAAWAVHAGLWGLIQVGMTVLLGRPWFALAVVSAVWLVLVQVNNAKYKSLREPFVFHDYEYFTDAIRHPRLYIPFLGWPKFFGAAAGVLAAVAIGLMVEPVSDQRWAWDGQLGGVVLLLLGSAGALAWGARHLPTVSFRPVEDLQSLGFIASLWGYARAAAQVPGVQSPFADVSSAGDWSSQMQAEPQLAHQHQQLHVLSGAKSVRQLPHLLAVQSESFFDPRLLYAGIRPEALAGFDQLQAEGVLRGTLGVPAWGANTIRTEFAFLTGIAAQLLGVHQFNPYRVVASRWQPASLASWLRAQGYRTVCVHPYPVGFYQRKRVYPRLGFDEFLDIRAFAGRQHEGPYMDDAAVAEKISAVLLSANQPTFVFAITMENHGPLHLESVRPDEDQAFYTQPPSTDCDDLTIYLRHLHHADAMVTQLRSTLLSLGSRASLCWYGDHVPIMPNVYRRYGLPSGRVPYVCWNNWPSAYAPPIDLCVEDLSRRWLHSAGLMNCLPSGAACSS
ncbi:LTA synthase family protein [Castellaniella sp.]|uniref:LTA synthase family protein n=1 Tax=Castellaniella sp. TaxID=1955812 RepID=UPI002B0011B8|nr:LTA synthase family protein [Castellaniella sp.]